MRTQADLRNKRLNLAPHKVKKFQLCPSNLINCLMVLCNYSSVYPVQIQTKSILLRLSKLTELLVDEFLDNAKFVSSSLGVVPVLAHVHCATSPSDVTQQTIEQRELSFFSSSTWKLFVCFFYRSIGIASDAFRLNLTYRAPSHVLTMIWVYITINCLNRKYQLLFFSRSLKRERRDADSG